LIEVGLIRMGSGGIKNPLVPDGSRGERAVSCLVSCLRAGQVRGSAGTSRVTPYSHPGSRQPLTRLVSHSETDERPARSSPAPPDVLSSVVLSSAGLSSAVLSRASTPDAPSGRASRKPWPSSQP